MSAAAASGTTRGTRGLKGGQMGEDIVVQVNGQLSACVCRTATATPHAVPAYTVRCRGTAARYTPSMPSGEFDSEGRMGSRPSRGSNLVVAVGAGWPWRMQKSPPGTKRTPMSPFPVLQLGQPAPTPVFTPYPRAPCPSCPVLFSFSFLSILLPPQSRRDASCECAYPVRCECASAAPPDRRRPVHQQSSSLAPAPPPVLAPPTAHP